MELIVCSLIAEVDSKVFMKVGDSDKTLPAVVNEEHTAGAERQEGSICGVSL